MLELITDRQNPLETGTSVEDNIKSLKSELNEYATYKIDTADKKWFKGIYISHLIEIDSISGNGNIKGIDEISQGILSEVFFLNACKQVGIECTPSTGADDCIGIDFRLSSEDETRFFDISVYSNKRNLLDSIKEGRFPVLFVPWRNRDYGMSYAEAYIRYGFFDGRRFLERTVKKNESILFKLESDMSKKMIFKRYNGNGRGMNFPEADIQYYNNFVGTLSLLERNLSKN